MVDGLLVMLVRFVLVVSGYLCLESYLESRPAVTAIRAGFCALAAIWIDRQVLGNSDDAAAAGSVSGIIAANYLMTLRRRRKGQVE